MNLAKMGLGAMNAAQYKLTTAAHNVNNSAVEGYNRQTVLTQTAGAKATGAGYVGRGVQTVTVNRSYDNFLFNQLVQARSGGAALKSYSTEIAQLDTLLSDRTVGVSPAIERFFASVNAVASEPADPAAREEMLGQANNLATQIRETDAFLTRQRENLNTQITTMVDQVNSYLERINDANQQIVKARASASPHAPNDLLDQRDQLLKELNELVGVKVFEQEGRFNLSIGNGQVVLSGSEVYHLQAMRSEGDPTRIVVGITRTDSTGARVPVEMDESTIQGGELGGLISYRKDVLDSVQNNLGRLAMGLASAFNKAHGKGDDLNGERGQAFFQVGGPKLIPELAGFGAKIADVNGLTGHDYRVNPVFNEDGDLEKFEITNLSTGVGPVTIDKDDVYEGLKFSYTGTQAGAAPVNVQPTRYAASGVPAGGATPGMPSGLQVLITDPAKIAAAGEKTGTANGDNALNLAKLQFSKELGGGTMSITEAFSQIVNKIGVSSQQNATALKAQESLINQTYAAQQQVSGVNLNEEYVNIENALEMFRAASKMIEVSSTMFDTLLSMR